MSKGAGPILGCILAGGLSRRMGGGDKALLPLGGVSMLARVAARLGPQVQQIVLNANGDPSRFADLGLPVVADEIEGFAGPLAGVCAGMGWAHSNTPACTHIVTAAADTPFFPADLVTCLTSGHALRPDTIVMATSDGNRHPVFALWPVELRDDLAAWLERTDTFKVLAWARRHDLQMVDFPLVETADGPLDPFFNANTPEDFALAEKILSRTLEEQNAGEPG
ncbi:molybdenum cofactor guanylyltransferase MobA [Hoeflea sp.]|uniref:molybdenum cofactor guanylyltransferase MobA n=1 Tax=Hoeflea sp. TaxID=1940281 RepID=UPI003B02A6B8